MININLAWIAIQFAERTGRVYGFLRIDRYGCVDDVKYNYIYYKYMHSVDINFENYCLMFPALLSIFLHIYYIYTLSESVLESYHHLVSFEFHVEYVFCAEDVSATIHPRAIEPTY